MENINQPDPDQQQAGIKTLLSYYWIQVILSLRVFTLSGRKFCVAAAIVFVIVYFVTGKFELYNFQITAGNDSQ